MSGWEAGMLICFGVSWPVSIAKALRTKRSDGKSRLFLSIIYRRHPGGIPPAREGGPWSGTPG